MKTFNETLVEIQDKLRELETLNANHFNDFRRYLIMVTNETDRNCWKKSKILKDIEELILYTQDCNRDLFRRKIKDIEYLIKEEK